MTTNDSKSSAVSQPPERIVLASSNQGKLRELGDLLIPFGCKLLPQSELAIADAVEDGLSFVENALIKARHAAKQSGLPALADDSGIAVDALQGAPGIYSARYCEMVANQARSDEANIAALVAKLKEQGAFEQAKAGGLSGPVARYHCVLAFVRTWDDPVPLLASVVLPWST